MEYHVELVWSALSLLILLAVVFYSYRVVRHFRDNAELASTRIFLQERTALAFIVFAIGIGLNGLAMAAGVAALFYDEVIYRYGTKAASLIMFLTWLYFMQTMAAVTGRPHEETATD